MVMQRQGNTQDAAALRTLMDRMFDPAILRPFTALSALTEPESLPIDVSQTDDAYVVKAEMPGVKPEDVQITIHGNTVSIRGEVRQEEERQDQRYLVRERRMGTYFRTFTLPTAVDPDRAEANFDNGVLTLTIPKSEAAKPKRVKVRSNTPMLQEEASPQTTNVQATADQTADATAQP